MSEKLPAWIPDEVAEALKAAADAQWNGKLEIHFNNGQAMEIHATRKVKVHRKPAGALAVQCPECKAPMEGKDYGNLWVCKCGAKRTRHQISASQHLRMG